MPYACTVVAELAADPVFRWPLDDESAAFMSAPCSAKYRTICWFPFMLESSLNFFMICCLFLRSVYLFRRNAHFRFPS